MLEKDPNERMTIDEVLAVPIMIKHAANYLPKDIFAAEFPIYNRSMLVEEEKVVDKPIAIEPKKPVPKPDVKLPVKAGWGVYDTRAVHGDKIVSFG